MAASVSGRWVLSGGRRMRVLLAVLVLLMGGQSAAQDQSSQEPGWLFHTGAAFLEIQSNKPSMVGVDSLYVAALSDAFNVQAITDSSLAWVPICTHKRQSLQLTAIFKKWLHANPERWHEPAPSLFLEAIRAKCVVR